MTLASPSLDLTSCDREPIRTPGSVQPHGCVLALAPDGTVVQASDNLAHHLGVSATAALGRTLAGVVGDAIAAQLEGELAGELSSVAGRPNFAATVRLNGGCFDVLVHRYDALLMLEFEAVQRTGVADFRHLYPLVGDFLQKLGDGDPVEKMSATAAAEIRAVTGFNRVLVYRFDDEGHGHVLAESGDGGLPSYLGQRFPATDIPKQARELYALNRIRLIHDANYTPARLVPPENPLTGALNDLSFAALRSVSPVHLQYMRNMGTMASMSVSLMVQGRLWGLISCHNAAACHITFDKRTACEQLGQILALRIESREMADELQFRLEVRRTMVDALAGLTQGADFIENMGNVFPQLLHFARAGGVAVVVDDRIVGFGETPGEAQVRALVGWLQANTHDDLYHTEQLAADYPPAYAFRQVASGLLAMPISRIHQHYLLWFRPEVVYTIDWAGKPREKEGDIPADAPRELSPRTSFASWRETVHGTALPWHPGELEMAVEFRTALLGIALERAEQMAELADELGRANKELEAFSYSVSHDLRAPLRHIAGFADLLMEAAGNDSLEKRQRFLKNIKESARLAGKLVDDLLSFSQMGRASLRPVHVDMNDLVRSCVDKVKLDAGGGRNIVWHVGELPAVTADPTFLQLAVINLLSNAVKFTGQKDPAEIRIEGRRTDTESVFSVADNGTGFNMDYVHKLFGVFQRLHRMEDFQGTGIGLANVRRIVERHGGRVAAQGALNEGATFTFTIPNILPST
ncbi:light-regulated signal transduction histidine kinase (bacteriophytochrome) [Pseudoduganella lurida]|uniref:histidine kinase n=1 Tax=Pseudoduganella lurida TaxID=1036180 RepID=A0A562RC58_9BURK|nr:ATP-binding protein [Pseudoduganella lurida]TWI66625.1 light-regulated signal transduction histidine kinase (bacteriophytochrome) [Pseudoduganella lurida]